MTINKSQGQSFDHVGLYLPEPVFAHGQLYVALSRCSNAQHLKVFVGQSSEQGKLYNDRTFTRNVVLRPLLL